MSTVPVVASAMRVPEAVGRVVSVRCGYRFWEWEAQALISGNSRVLPVSVTDAAALAGAEGRAGPTILAADPPELGDEGFEPPQPAASTARGTRAAAMPAIRIGMATGEYSFGCAC